VGFVVALEVELVVVWEVIWEVIREVALEALGVVLEIFDELLISRR
jgi:hypothetical protein